MSTVLVVDDRATNREVARETLGAGGYHIIEASDGRQALELAKSLHPDVVLTDMLMPGIDGFQFAQEMRGDSSTVDIPVIFYTANYSRDEVRALAEALGVNRIVEKTATPQELLDSIAATLRESPSTRIGPPEPQTTQHIDVLNAKLFEKTGALDESEARFAAMAEASPVGIIITELSGRATYVNPGARRITGWGDTLIGDGWVTCLGTEFRDLVSVAGQTDGQRRECRFAHPDGRERRLTVLVRSILDGEGTKTGSVVVIDDLTAMVEAEERRRLDDLDRAGEARRQATARFDSLTRLAGGIAHDFNNLLNVILSFGDFLDESLDEAAERVLTSDRSGAMRHDIDRIRQAGRRAAELTHQLLTFGGKDVIKPVLLDLNAVVNEIIERIPTPAEGTVTITTSLAPDLSTVRGDTSQLRQVLIDLTTNAVEAMSAGGRLDITTEDITETSAHGVTDNLVHLRVTDTGGGMKPEILDQAMEPFFTTKPKGTGPGLGLATSYGIVRQSGGRLLLESKPGHGTSAHVYLPAARPVTAPAPPSADSTGGAGRTVLVAEDEPGLREVILRILRKDGFHVLSAGDGSEAAAIAAQHDGPIHAVLTDVVMPAMNGRELAAELALTRPGTPIQFMSGYAEPLMNEQGLIEADLSVLRKPFTRTELLAAVHRVLIATD